MLKKLGDALQIKAKEIFGHEIPAILVIPSWKNQESPDKSGVDVISNVGPAATVNSLVHAVVAIDGDKPPEEREGVH